MSQRADWPVPCAHLQFHPSTLRCTSSLCWSCCSALDCDHSLHLNKKKKKKKRERPLETKFMLCKIWVYKTKQCGMSISIVILFWRTFKSYEMEVTFQKSVYPENNLQRLTTQWSQGYVLNSVQKPQGTVFLKMGPSHIKQTNFSQQNFCSFSLPWTPDRIMAQSALGGLQLSSHEGAHGL